jgi:hypothetical protein
MRSKVIKSVKELIHSSSKEIEKYFEETKLTKSDLQNYAEELGISKNSSGLKNKIKSNILNTAMYIRISNK